MLLSINSQIKQLKIINMHYFVLAKMPNYSYLHELLNRKNSFWCWKLCLIHFWLLREVQCQCVFVCCIHILDRQNHTNINYRDNNIVSSLSFAYLQKTKQTEMHNSKEKKRKEKKNKPRRNKIRNHLLGNNNKKQKQRGKTHRCLGTKDDLDHWLY